MKFAMIGQGAIGSYLRTQAALHDLELRALLLRPARLAKEVAAGLGHWRTRFSMKVWKQRPGKEAQGSSWQAEPSALSIAWKRLGLED